MITINIKKVSLRSLCDMQQLSKVRVEASIRRLNEIDDEIRSRLSAGETAGDECDISVVPGRVKYHMDWKRWGEIKTGIPEHLRPTRWVEAVFHPGVVRLRDAEPDTYQKVLGALTVTPSRDRIYIEAKPTKP